MVCKQLRISRNKKKTFLIRRNTLKETSSRKELCITKLLKFLKRVSNILGNRRGLMDFVFFDHQKAFNINSHRRLMKQLERMCQKGINFDNWERAYSIYQESLRA